MKSILSTLTIILFSAIGFTQSIPDSCYLVNFPFDGNANDIADSTYSTTVMGPILTTGVDGSTNSAYLFDGVDDHIILNNHNAIMYTDVFTISCWARMDGTGGGTGSKNALFSQRDIANPGTQGVVTVLADNGSGNIAFALKGSTTATSTIVLTTPSVSYLDWHHYAFVFDETNTMRIYVDGSEVDSMLYNGSGDFVTNIDDVTIGRQFHNTSAVGVMNGAIDEFKIFRCALSSNEIEDLATLTDDTCSYLLDCSFNGSAIDNSNNSHPTTVYGPTLTSDKDGNPYSAYLFDGIDDYIEVNNHNAIMDADVFTIACWARMDGTGGGNGSKNALFSHRDIANPGTQGVVTVLADNGAGNIAFALKGSTTATSTIVLTTPSPSYLDWHHYAFVFDETETMRIYVDGIEVDNMLYTGSGDFITNINDVTIGRQYHNTDAVGIMNGAIDEVKIMDCALSALEVNDLMNEPLQPSNIESTVQLENNFEVFPNPTSNLVHFTSRNNEAIEFSLKLYDISGNLILEEYTFNSRYSLDLRTLSEGIYQYRITNNGNLIGLGKLVKIND